jgi:dTMP kinase
MSTALIVPLTPEEKKQLAEFERKVNSLVALAGMDITDQASLAKSGEAKLSLETYHKAVKNFFEGKLGSLEEEVKRLKLQRSQLTSTTEPALKALVQRQRDWMAEEKRRADAEARRKQEEIDRENQRKIDEDRRRATEEAARKKADAVAKIEEDFKAGMYGKREYARLLRAAGAEEEAAKATAAAVAEEEAAKSAPTVRVAPSIPKTPGIRNQTYYYAEVTDRDAIKMALADALREQNKVRTAFLLQFLVIDDSVVSKYARDTKNNEKTMKDLPGVRAWSQG